MTEPESERPGARLDAEAVAAFCALHMPVLQTQQVRHNIIISILERAMARLPAGLRLWTLGPAGRCATMSPRRPIALTDLDERECRTLAEQTRTPDYVGVVGPDGVPPLFAGQSAALGVAFGEPMPQRILALAAAPRHPDVPGSARAPSGGDVALVADWVEAFIREAMPHDPVPPRDEIVRRVEDGSFCLWEMDGRPVSMGAIVRRTRDTGAISYVYMLPAERGRGYAGAVTAALVEQVFAEGRSTACLYTDARNLYSNRCYEKIGFRQVCETWFFPRERPGA